jgi:hypothetical protein
MIHSFPGAVRKIPNGVEAFLVLSVTFGLFAWAQWTSNESPDTGAGAVVYADQESIDLILWELFLLVSIGAFLWARGWRPEDLALNPSWRLTGIGVLLWFVDMMIYYIAWAMLAFIPAMAASAQNMQFSVEVSLSVLILVSIVNPIFEELLTVVYLFKRFAWARPASIILMSASLRASVHVYQGAFSMLTMALTGILFAAYFAKRRQAWPLVVAHAIGDFIGLTQ